MSARMPALPLSRSLWSTIKLRLLALLTPAEPEPLDYVFGADEVAALHGLDGGASVDAQTWSDLLMDDYAARLSAGVSIFGRQVLHQRLRGALAPEARAALVTRLQALEQDGARGERLRDALRCLRAADSEVATLLFGPSPEWASPAKLRYLRLLPLALVASVAGAALSPASWLATAAVMVALISVQAGLSRVMQRWDRQVHALQMLLRACTLLGAQDPALADLGARAGKLNRALSPSMLDAVPLLKPYRDWFLLANVHHYYRQRRLVGAHLPLLRACFLAAANGEADLALGRHLRATTAVCWVNFDDQIAFDAVVHPLLDGAAPLSIALGERGAFVSGQNGSGKSTLLRTLGLNLIVARAFGFCYARAATVPDAPVYASMQGEDSLAKGESLYIAELRRARELLDAPMVSPRATYLIDEIFRGTNHLESVSVGAAVLHALAARGRVVVASHNLVLAPLLVEQLAPLYVRRRDGALSIEPGVLAETNGIALLTGRGFGARIEADAARVHDWLGSYLAKPADCGGVLRA